MKTELYKRAFRAERTLNGVHGIFSACKPQDPYSFTEKVPVLSGPRPSADGKQVEFMHGRYIRITNG